ncbi:6a6c280b-755d-4884-8bd3-fc363dc20355 [Sclerotinia trifoliorum]|uniref:6a6c280b-755d-4884-8bd3-fc363dc20355 n=1 Tax=Sclerotinia trifoliorum TaxID=28548 RepID=A0A8H2ZPI6_9HELO|nr:6a6c280b-755d-4884-8bd3-fc363dc20355 [Sclerotinia trifoliorum]
MSDALDAIQALYDTGKYSDMKIRCEDKVFNAHRAVVCMRSPVIAAAMDDDRWEEAAKGEYHMSDDELPVVEAMIHYLYLRTYDDQVVSPPEALGSHSQVEIGKDEMPPSPPTLGSESEPDPEPELDTWRTRANLSWNNGGIVPEAIPVSLPSSLLLNAKVYIIADKYMIPALKSLACEKCSKSLEEHWNTPEFSATAELLWENTPSSDMLLRDSVVATAASNIDVLLDRGEFVEFMSAHGDFAVEVLKRVIRKIYPDTTSYVSPHYRKVRRSGF